MKVLPNEKILLKRRRYFWPLLMIPYFKGSHTVEITGIRRRRLKFLKDVKVAQTFCTLFLTSKRLYCELIFPKIFLVEILLSDIRMIKINDKDDEVLEIEFEKCKWSWLLRLFMSGPEGDIPKNKVLLNLGEDIDKWLKSLKEYTHLKGMQ